MLSANNRQPRGSGSDAKRNEDNDDYDRRADRSAAARTKVGNEGLHGEESSDQKMILGLSGNDESDHFNSIINIPNNQNDILEFECFMNGIQSKLQEKELRKKKKLDNLLGGLSSRDRLGLMQGEEGGLLSS